MAKVLLSDNLNSTNSIKLTTLQANHATPLLGTKYWIASQNSPVLFTLFSGSKKIADLTVSCLIREPEMQILNYVHQLICRNGTEFEMVIFTTFLSRFKFNNVLRLLNSDRQPNFRHRKSLQ